MRAFVPGNAALMLALASTLTTSATAAADADAPSSTAAPLAGSVTRLAGGDRYGTAVAVSQQFDPGVPVVYVASGTNFPDALSSAPVATLQGGPLLLTAPWVLPASVRAEIVRLAPALIVVSGGTASVSTAVFDELATLAPQIRRDAGGDRYATSLAVNTAAFSGKHSTEAFLAAGSNYPDALSASAVAGGHGAPVMLVYGGAGALDPSTAGLLTQLGVTKLYIAGGTAVISPGIENSAKALLGSTNVIRLSGADRYETSNAINRTLFTSAPTAYIASGGGFADGLAGAALAGRDHAPLFVAPTGCVPDDELATFQQFGTTNRVLLGGPASLGAGVENNVACSSLIPPPPVTPPTGPTKPANPGDTKNCSDFATWGQAQAWFNTYYPYYGDIAKLDGDNNGIACESLPGAPR